MKHLLKAKSGSNLIMTMSLLSIKLHVVVRCLSILLNIHILSIEIDPIENFEYHLNHYATSFTQFMRDIRFSEKKNIL